MTLDLSAHLSPDSQRRLLLFTALLLWTSLTFQTVSQSAPAEANGTVFEHPPAYLHPTEVIGFNLSGLPPVGDSTADALRAAAASAIDPSARAQTHLGLAVYYKQHGKRALAENEKRKGDYWARVARIQGKATVDAR